MGMTAIFKRFSGLLAMLGMLSLGLAPVPVMADASNTRFVPRHAKAKSKPRAVRKAAAKPAAAAAPQQPAPVEVAQPAPPAAVEPTPTPVAEATPPAPTPTAPAAKLSVAKKGGKGTVIALLGLAGVIAAVTVASSTGSVSR